MRTEHSLSPPESLLLDNQVFIIPRGQVKHVLLVVVSLEVELANQSVTSNSCIVERSNRIEKMMLLVELIPYQNRSRSVLE